MIRYSLIIIISFGVLFLVPRSDIFIPVAFEQLCITGHHSVRYSSSNSCYACQEEAFFQILTLSTVSIRFLSPLKCFFQLSIMFILFK